MHDDLSTVQYVLYVQLAYNVQYSKVNIYNIMFVKLVVLILAILSIAAAADLEEVTHRVYFDIEIDGR